MKKNAGNVDLFEQLVDERKLFKIVNDLKKAGDEQSANLLYQIRRTFQDRLSLSSGDEHAWQRLQGLLASADRWGPDLIRNNVFKIANSLGMKLPSSMFASETASLREAWGPTLGAVNPEEGVGEGQQFANMVSKKWQGVKYDAKRGTGTASLGGLQIRFWESQNDPAVVAEIVRHPQLKADPDALFKSLSHIAHYMSRM